MAKPFFPTERTESRKTRRFRRLMNLWPVYWGTGGRITFISADWHEVHVRIPLNWWTRNYVGTIYGGTLYSAVDPFFMLMLLKILGEKEHIVWDKSATIRFKKPGKSTLYCRFLVPEELVAEIRAASLQEYSVTRVIPIELVDAAGSVHVEVDKEVYVRRKDAVRPA